MSVVEIKGLMVLHSAHDIRSTLKLSAAEGPPRYVAGNDALAEKF
jgi:hypothetical protein